MEPSLTKLGHVEMTTPDLDTSVWFFSELIGLNEVDREGDRVYLRGNRDWEHHTLTLVGEDEATINHIGWRTRRPEDLDAYAELLREAGFDVSEVEAGEELAQGKAIRFRIPSGQVFELYFEMEKPDAERSRKSRLRNRVYRRSGVVSPERIDHATMTAPNPFEVQSWLQETLGFQLNEYVRGSSSEEYLGAWMSVTPMDHDAAFVTDPESRTGQFHHVAYYYDSVHDLLEAAEFMYENEVVLDGGPGKHNVANSNFVYVKDPGSGHRIELYTGGYLILEPDWEPIEWTEADRNKIGDRKGMEVYGLPPGNDTTSF